MPRLLIRIIALLLAPCLIADAGSAACLSGCWTAAGALPLHFQDDNFFREQALAGAVVHVLRYENSSLAAAGSSDLKVACLRAEINGALKPPSPRRAAELEEPIVVVMEMHNNKGYGDSLLWLQKCGINVRRALILKYPYEKSVDLRAEVRESAEEVVSVSQDPLGPVNEELFHALFKGLPRGRMIHVFLAGGNYLGCLRVGWEDLLEFQRLRDPALQLAFHLSANLLYTLDPHDPFGRLKVLWTKTMPAEINPLSIWSGSLAVKYFDLLNWDLAAHARRIGLSLKRYVDGKLLDLPGNFPDIGMVPELLRTYSHYAPSEDKGRPGNHIYYWTQPKGWRTLPEAMIRFFRQTNPPRDGALSAA